MSRIKVDLINQKFGKLTVLSQCEQVHGKTGWLCLCECGNTKKISGVDLRNGKVKTCGCRYESLVGQVFGKLTVIKFSHSDNGAYWECLCSCGNSKIVSAGNLRAGTASCGCSWHGTHQLSSHPLHNTWEDMKKRCYNPNRQDYKNYGGRGIVMCDDWKNNFVNFYNDMIIEYDDFIKNNPTKKISIERIDNNGNYEPNNCTFIDITLQGRNRRVNKLDQTLVTQIRDEYKNSPLTWEQLATKYNVCIGTIYKVLHYKLWK